MLSYTRVIFLCFVLFFAAGCSNTDNKKSIEAVNTANPYSFANYVKAIHKLRLPFSDTCYDTMRVQRLKMPDTVLKINSGLHQTPQIIGKVAETDTYVAILYALPADIQLPVLKTFDKEGKKISMLRLLIGKCCGENEDCNGMSCVTITKDMRIILRDSTVTFQRNKRNSNKKKDIKVSTRTETYKIDTDGKIVKVSAPNA